MCFILDLDFNAVNDKSDPSENRKPSGRGERVSDRETTAGWRSTLLISVSSRVEIKVVKVLFQFQVVWKRRTKSMISVSSHWK